MSKLQNYSWDPYSLKSSFYRIAAKKKSFCVKEGGTISSRNPNLENKIFDENRRESKDILYMYYKSTELFTGMLRQG